MEQQQLQKKILTQIFTMVSTGKQNPFSVKKFDHRGIIFRCFPLSRADTSLFSRIVVGILVLCYFPFGHLNLIIRQIFIS